MAIKALCYGWARTPTTGPVTFISTLTINNMSYAQVLEDQGPELVCRFIICYPVFLTVKVELEAI